MISTESSSQKCNGSSSEDTCRCHQQHQNHNQNTEAVFKYIIETKEQPDKEIHIEIKKLILRKNRAQRTKDPVNRNIEIDDIRDVLRLHFNERWRVHLEQLGPAKINFRNHDD